MLFNSVDNNPPYALFANVGATPILRKTIPIMATVAQQYFPNGTYTLTVVDLRAADGVGGPFPKNRIATGRYTLGHTKFTVYGMPALIMAGMG
ncbi:MAG: hypothetical protein R2822_17395 [Spirosomataceae bacterium]